MQRRIFSLLFPIAGVLLFQSAQAQTTVIVGPPLLEANGVAVSGPTPGTYNVARDPLNAASGALNAENGGTITGIAGTLTLNQILFNGQLAPEARMLRAIGTGSLVDMTGVQLDINIPVGVIGPRTRAALADTGGTVILTGGNIVLGDSPSPGSRALESDNPGALLSATDTNVAVGSRTIDAFTYGGGKMILSGIHTVPLITLNGSNSWGIGTWAADADVVGTTLTATNIKVIVNGGQDGQNNIVYAVSGFRGIRSTLTTLDNCTVTATGPNNWGLYAVGGGEIVLNHSTVTSLGSSAGLVDSGSILRIDGQSTISGDLNGIVISDEDHTLGRRDTVELTGKSTLTNLQGAAFKVEGADVDITVTDSTIDSGSGVGATQHTLLDVNQIDLVGSNHPSDVALTADNSILNGDILVDASSRANVVLTSNSVLTGAINENTLTGASGINPNEPAVNLPPQTVNLSVDGTSTWIMRASSTLNTVDVTDRARIVFTDPPGDPFKTLVMNNLTGTGGIFKLNNDLAAIKGDLINILNSSDGGHLVLFNNRTVGSDLPVDTALLVVKTTDGHAVFGGVEQGGTFLYFVRRGNGSSITPVTTDWYLVRGDEITPPGPSPSPSPSPTPAPPGPQPSPSPIIPPDVLPPDILPPGRLSRIDDLTPGANAAIGTFAATMPLFYADMDTLIQRLGELRLQTQAAPPPTTPIPSGISKEGGKEVVAPPPPVAPPPGGGVWFRGFGSGSHIDDQVSRSFHQNLGGFQIGADKRLVTRYGDLYLGGFLGYFYAHRDFQNQPFNQDATGTTQALSVGAYGTLIHPSGFYADLVVKYTQLWNDFDAPNVLSSLGPGPSATANYSIPTFGASLEIGKRWDFGHFFVEPQGQIEGAWADGTDYTVSTGLRVSADSQTSLRGRLGLRAGYHFDCGSMAFEPYAKVSVINEFLGGDRITTNQSAFFPTLSGVGIHAAGGVTARITDSIYLYGEYDYANSDKVRIPWAVDAGFRWAW